MRVSSFTVILTFVILMVIGIALAPQVDVGTEPTLRQGKTMTISYVWPNVSAKVIEQNLTSPVEGMLSAIKGVEKVSSYSYFGRNEIVVRLKENTDVSAVRFEMASMLRQSYGRLPKGISYPTIEGGEVVNSRTSHHDQALLLTYQVNGDMQADRMKDFISQDVVRRIEAVEGVRKVEVTGVPGTYMEVSYNPMVLSAHGITASDMAEGIRNYFGQDEIIGTVMRQVGKDGKEKITLHLTTAEFAKSLEQMPIKNISGKMVYLNDLATIQVRKNNPDGYYRVNGMNTIYMNVYIPSDGKMVAMSDLVQEEMQSVKENVHNGVYFTLSYDAAKQQREEMYKLIWRTLLSLLLLLVFVWLVSHDIKYLLIIASALVANLLMAIIAIWMFDLKLNVYSLAGVTVSLGLLIDSTIVMADHYGYYHDRKVFLSILTAMLTTIGSMVIVFFLPKELQQNLYDFAWIIIVNLAVSLLVAFFFVPAVMDRCRYNSRERWIRHARLVARWSRFYKRYILFTSRHRWIYYALLVLAFGIPFHALPEKIGMDEDSYMEDKEEHLTWYADWYNHTFGSDFFQNTCKEPLSAIFGGTIKMFSDYLDERAHHRDEKEERRLHIEAQMPIGGTAVQLNRKMVIVEEMLKKYKEIKEFVTRINGRYGEIVVKFKDDAAKTSFPYRLENDVIGKVITIGGADWSTFGISERGFSNALNLQHRSEKITLFGYNYDQLYRLAEDMSDYLGHNKRVVDIAIETPGHESQENELYMKYDKENINLYGLFPKDVHRQVEQILMPSYVGYYKGYQVASDVYLSPTTSNTFDLWHLRNEQVVVDSSQVFVPDLMDVRFREAKNIIPKENQEYVLNLAFNVLGSYSYTSTYIDNVIKHFNQVLPVGYRCVNTYYVNPANDGANYWLLLLVVVVVFFICAIQFESVKMSMVIVSVIPIALIGAFLTFSLTGVDFGSGGFASLVLLMGIVVNSGIYILGQFRHVCRITSKGSVRGYVCAYNHKIIPICLTVASTIMGLVPFFLDGEDAAFWFSFATGVTGGLLFSLPALVFVMPLFVDFKVKSHG